MKIRRCISILLMSILIIGYTEDTMAFVDFPGTDILLAANTPVDRILPKITISFVGDCMISTHMGAEYEGSFNWYALNQDPSYFLSGVSDLFMEDDLTIANCETTLSDEKLIERDKGQEIQYWFVGPKSNALIFAAGGVDLVSTANNHVFDYGPEGAEDTLDALYEAGLQVAQNRKPVYFTRDGITIGILACGIWSEGSEYWVKKLLQEMEEQSDIQIIYPHGGEERVREPEKWRIEAFHNLIDWGADIVIGNHAHVLQPMEIYKECPIVYGLGNFCFGGNNKPENRTIIYQCTVIEQIDGTYSYESNIIPCYVYTGTVNNWQPAVITDEREKQKVLDFMNWKQATPF